MHYIGSSISTKQWTIFIKLNFNLMRCVCAYRANMFQFANFTRLCFLHFTTFYFHTFSNFVLFLAVVLIPSSTGFCSDFSRRIIKTRLLTFRKLILAYCHRVISGYHINKKKLNKKNSKVFKNCSKAANTGDITCSVNSNPVFTQCCTFQGTTKQISQGES